MHPSKRGKWRGSVSSDSLPFTDDSIEIPTNDSVDEIYNQSHLTERIQYAEKKFSTSSIATSVDSSEYFEYPALYRVLLMGSTSDDKKNKLFKKLTQGFAYVLVQNGYNDQNVVYVMGQPIVPFKERKHNLLLLNDNEKHIHSDIYEDVGISMIEADFTWNSNAMIYSKDSRTLLLQYAHSQCFPKEQVMQDKYVSYIYPERTPNGIDLCVYFYDGLDDQKTIQDLDVLNKLRQLGIYVLPLISPLGENKKAYFADLLTKHNVRCLDISNLEVGQLPTFLTKKHPITEQMEYTVSNVRVAPYQLLTVDQFCNIENNMIFEILKRTRKRQKGKKSIREEPLARSVIETHSYFSWPVVILSLLVLILLSYVIRPQQIHWSFTLTMNPEHQFVLSSHDSTGNIAWPPSDPFVWLNQEQCIPTRKMNNEGYYELDFNITHIDHQQILTLQFYINSTYPSNSPSTTFILLPSTNTPPPPSPVAAETIIPTVPSPPPSPARPSPSFYPERLYEHSYFIITNLKSTLINLIWNPVEQ